MKDNYLSEKAAASVKKRRIILFILASLAVIIICEFIRSNTYIQTENITVKSSRIPSEFDGVRIVHISDYHNHGGSYDDRLIKKISLESPDYIFITGDIEDSICPDVNKADSFLEKISKTAPCYIVWGNHDLNLPDGDLENMRNCALTNNITVLENQFTYITRGSDRIMITGTEVTPNSINISKLLENDSDSSTFSIWLHHYPENFTNIVSMTSDQGHAADLLFTGHAHGGLIRLPFIKGLYAPGQGMFPEYTSGIYSYNESQMIVNRGVGNSGYTRRFLDPFHVVVCTLSKAENS